MWLDTIAIIVGYAVIICAIITATMIIIYLTVSYSVGLFLKLTNGTANFFKFLKKERYESRFGRGKA